MDLGTHFQLPYRDCYSECLCSIGPFGREMRGNKFHTSGIQWSLDIFWRMKKNTLRCLPFLPKPVRKKTPLVSRLFEDFIGSSDHLFGDDGSMENLRNAFWESFRPIIHPEKLTCPLKRHQLNRKYIFQPLIFRGHSFVFGGVVPIGNHNKIVDLFQRLPLPASHGDSLDNETSKFLRIPPPK